MWKYFILELSFSDKAIFFKVSHLILTFTQYDIFSVMSKPSGRFFQNWIKSNFREIVHTFKAMFKFILQCSFQFNLITFHETLYTNRKHFWTMWVELTRLLRVTRVVAYNVPQLTQASFKKKSNVTVSDVCSTDWTKKDSAFLSSVAFL